MATVSSFTEDKIRELLAGWEGVSLSQETINVLVGQLRTIQQTADAEREILQQQTIPQLIADVASGAIAVSDLQATVIPDLQAALAQNDAELVDLQTVTIPALQADLAATSQNVLDSPKSYYTELAPLNPDDELRELVVGDNWYDPNDDNKQYVWNGAMWSTLSADVADFSLTAKKFKTSTHMIY